MDAECPAQGRGTRPALRYFVLAGVVHLLIFVAVPASWLRGASDTSPPLLVVNVAAERATPPRRAIHEKQELRPAPGLSDSDISRAVAESEPGRMEAPDAADSFFLRSRPPGAGLDRWRGGTPIQGEIIESFTDAEGAARVVLRKASGETLCFRSTAVDSGMGDPVILWVPVHC